MESIFWINGAEAPHLAIVLCPRGDERLEDEMRKLKEGGIDTVVSLLKAHEVESLGLSREEKAANRAGIAFLSYPIPDTEIPEDEGKFRRFVRGIAGRLKDGERVGVHCRGSIGRSTVTAACALIELGWQPGMALNAIEEARGVPVPDTYEQEEWIYHYKAKP
jgi:protein-tyrosine phosphatase